MDFYDQIEFISFNTVKSCRAFIDYTFDYYSVNLVTGGYLYFISESGRKTKISAPGVWWTVPGRHYRYGCIDDIPWEQNWIAFKGPRADEYYKKGLLPDRELPIALIRSKMFIEDFRRTLKLLTHSHDRSVNMLERLLLELRHSQLTSANYAQALTPHIQQFSSLEEKMIKNPQFNFNFELEARKMSISYSHFRRLFKAFTHLSPQSYLIEQRLNTGAQMLLNTQMRISEIAEYCGFSDQYYFSRAFSKRYDLAPSDYRKANELSSNAYFSAG